MFVFYGRILNVESRCWKLQILTELLFLIKRGCAFAIINRKSRIAWIHRQNENLVQWILGEELVV